MSQLLVGVIAKSWLAKSWHFNNYKKFLKRTSHFGVEKYKNLIAFVCVQIDICQLKSKKVGLMAFVFVLSITIL